MNNHLAMQQSEIAQLQAEVAHLRELTQRGHAPPPPAPGPMGDPYHDQYARARPPELPPLRSLQPPTGSVPPESMAGVQYEPSRMNGYRPPEQGRF